MPAADPDLRERLEAEAREIGWDGMHRRLAGLDPEIAGRIHPNDPQRIQRALEVIELTGRRMSALQAQQKDSPFDYRVLRIVACPQPRSLLHQRIERRFDQMMSEGFMEEMRRRAIAATRQLAKRQLTWLRQESTALWYDPTVEDAQSSVFRVVSQFLE